MVNRKQACWIAVGVGAVALWAYAYRTGRAPSLTLPEKAVQQSWSPYAHWFHQSPAGSYHHYPETVGANCFPLIYQTEDIGQALNHVEVDRAGCAQ